MMLGRWIGRTMVGSAALDNAGPLGPGIEIMAPQILTCPEAPELPMVPEAGHLRQPDFATPRATARTLGKVDYYTYLNALVTRGRKRIVREADNTALEHPGVTPDQVYYWRQLYGRRPQTLAGLVMPLRSAANNYYHTVVDNLPRLYALNHPAYRGMPIKLLVPGKLQPAEAYFLPRLLPDNVAITPVAPHSLYRPETLLFSDFLSRQMAACLPGPYLGFFLERVLPTRPRQRHQRIYVTRRNAAVGRRILNEADLVRALERRGFVPVALETLSLDQQIELFFDAEAVVAPHGAGLTNLLWGDALEVLELHPASSMFPHYYFLCASMGHRYRYLCGDATGRHSDFSVDLNRLEERLEEMFGAASG
jgi:capsular polysaccharide biosynthesis protein